MHGLFVGALLTRAGTTVGRVLGWMPPLIDSTNPVRQQIFWNKGR